MKQQEVTEDVKEPFLRDCRNVAAEYDDVIARRVERARDAIAAGCSYREVADAMGLSGGWIYQMVNGSYYKKKGDSDGNS